MPTDNEDSGFLSRWSRRKVLVRQGATVADVAAPVAGVLTEWVAPDSASALAVAPEPAPSMRPGPEAEPQAQPAQSAQPAQPAQPAESAQPPAQPPAPTLADVAALTRDSDYSRFVARGVQPDVKNAALSKLFTDPHFNVMDRLDTYIDDYGKPDPLPPGMLRQMLQAHVLGLFDEEDEQKKTAAGAAPSPASSPAPTLAHAAPPEAAVPPNEWAAAPPTESSPDENTDLQLQPDHGAGCASLEPGPGQDAGGQHGRPGDGSHPAVPA